MELTTKTESASPSSRLQIHRLDASGSRQSDRNDAAVFNAAMTFVSSVELSQIVAAYDFLKVRANR
jgi:hypothetical protein